MPKPKLYYTVVGDETVRPTKANGHATRSTVTLAAVRALMRDDLKRSGLTENDLYAEPSLTDLHGASRYGYHIFYPDPDTGRKTTFERFRYLCPQSSWRFTPARRYDQLALPPIPYCPRGSAELRTDTSKPLVIPEGEKKAETARKYGIACIALGGMWNWKTKGEEELIPDLATFVWKERRVFVVVDSDAASNPHVRQGAERLAMLLIAEKAQVFLIILPSVTPNAKTGLDDFLLARGRSGWDALVEQSREWRYVLRTDLLYDAVQKAERILADDPAQKLFLYGTELVRVVEQEQAPEANGGLRRPQGNSYLSGMRAENVQFLLSASGRVFEWTKRTPENPKPRLHLADPKLDWCRQVIANVQTFPDRVPWQRLLLVTNTPLLLADGTLIDTPGFHRETGVRFDPRGQQFPPIPLHPTKEEARKALDKFAEVFQLFPFAKADAEDKEQAWNRSPSYGAVLATILSILIRHQLPTVPMLGISAPEAGTGKTKIAESIAAAATGCGPTRLCYDSTMEFEKLLPVALRAGDRALLIDNVIERVNSSKLAMVLTTDEPTDFRVLGESRAVKTPNRSVIMATGNQLIISGDLPRRSLFCKLTPNSEQPEARRFDFDPVTRARERFPKMVAAALTALRYYLQADCPQPRYDKDAALQSGSFEDWNRIVRGLLVHLRFGDPLATQKEVRSDDTWRQSDIALVCALHDKYPSEEKFTAADIKKVPGSEAYLLLCNKDGRWDPVRAGLRLQRMRDRVLDGLRLASGGGHVGGVAQYQLICERKECKKCGKGQKY